ncbi:hypothetical protein E4U54_004020 [Claviceps lovelessii]|nr:hypothetical protein E4U54_004020 [Claviceps lovelessii]
MASAWLDSLSEDWVSQPGSDTSNGQLPPLSPPHEVGTPQIRHFRSRIPRKAGPQSPARPMTGNSSNVLNERSANDINIFMRKLPSKLSQEAATDVSRPTSATMNGSIVRHNLHSQQLLSNDDDTPEWKRRLIHGIVPYGEQRDLFRSVAEGLQDMFKPPAEKEEEVPNDSEIPHHTDMTFPSSPPIYPQPITDADLEEYEGFDEEEEQAVDVTPSPSPRRLQRDIKHKPYQSSPIPDSRNAKIPVENLNEDDRHQEEIYQDQSCLTAPPESESIIRRFSGQSDTRNEEFSPIMIGKHNDENGNVDFARIEVPVDTLWQKLEALRVNQMLLDAQTDLRTSSDNSPGKPFEGDEKAEEDNQVEGFINFRRGGGSSGNGSFYNRGLSSEMGADTSEMLPEESLQASTPKEFPSIKIPQDRPNPTLQLLPSPCLPRAPFPSPDKKQIMSGDGHGSASSPLKLFGPYDTFTSQTLLRRISQFEQGSGSPSQRSRTSSDAAQTRSGANATDISFSRSGNVSKFGENDLDGYEFRSNPTDEIYEDSDVVGKENIAPHDTSLPLYPLREIGSGGRSPEGSSGLVVERKRRKNDSFSRSENVENSQLPNDAPRNSAAPKREPGSESKRPRTSPSKNPTPKRRRTLHRSDIAFGRDKKLRADESAYLQMQSLSMAKTRKDALSGNFKIANSEVLARRSILKPHSPSSSRSSSLSHKQLKKSPLRALRNSDHTGSRDAATETARKPSIRTQDFVDQAAQIMAMIRNQVKPDLASLEESEEEQIDPGERRAEDADSDQDSTNEPFSRPPSREGSVMPWAQQRQNDPEIINRLKKYQEMSDIGDAITSSSVRSSQPLAQNPALAEIDEEQQDEQRHQERTFDGPIPIVGDVISDLPNVRITSSRSDAERPSPVREFPTYESNRSSYRTYRSSSSRGSESRRVIMPESISHLIPDRVGSMCLDKDKKIWIKRKESNASYVPNILPSEDSEEDPFASIPDLSVDMTKEMQNLKLAKAANGAAPADAEVRLTPRDALERVASRNYETLSPDERTGFRSIGFANRELNVLDDYSGHHDVDKQVVSGDGERTSNVCSSTKQRHVTISFSSPIASVIRDLASEDLNNMGEGEFASPEMKLSQNSSTRSPSQTYFKNNNNGPQSLRVHNNQVPMRQSSLRDPSFMPRPVSRIDEQDEDSTVEIVNEGRQVSIVGDQSIMSHKTPQSRRASLSFILNRTPANGALSIAADDSAFIGRNVGKLSLSPLSEFTFNNADQSSFGFEVSYVMGQRHMATGNGSQKVLSMTIRELVDRLGEAEPEVSFWEDIMELDLHEKRLSSLHMLDEFCGRLVTLDASANKLSHLEGVPSTVRELKVSHNLLTELSSWDHLMNLQYVDISDNEVTSLSALKNLVHLRSLKADNNQLTSLAGLDSHDGLLSIRARGNKIPELDFATTRFKRLQDLDVSDNQISSVRNLDHLPELARLKLSKNRMTELPVVECMSWLRHLDVSDNELAVLDTSGFPNLHSIHADRNFIHQVYGFERTRRLDSLSLREQRGHLALDLGFLASAYEVRKLFLSGNLLQNFDPQVDFLNLQLLELANCGLQSLPEKMGQLMPNLRTLNVNLNAISALAPLRFIPRLKKLLVAGNRLADSTLVTGLLTEFPHLTELDVRDNPVTLGFYAPLQALVSASGSGGSADLFVLPDAEAARDEAFASRLDEATRLRRRLHQVALVASCKRLKKLDGLSVCRSDILAVDRLLQVLIDDGLIPIPEEQGEEHEQQHGEQHGVKEQQVEEQLNEKAHQPIDGVLNTEENDIDEETMADEQARAQLEEEAESAWHHNTTVEK